jgi:hypothetical protein
VTLRLKSLHYNEGKKVKVVPVLQKKVKYSLNKCQAMKTQEEVEV